MSEETLNLNSNKWQELGEITAAQAALGDAARTHAAVELLDDTKKVVLYLGQTDFWLKNIALEFRFRSDSDDDTVTNTLQSYAEAGEDHYTRIAQLVAKEGLQQYSSSIFFVDGITPSFENWITNEDSMIVQPVPTDDHIARFTINTHGYDRFLFIASALNSTTVYIDVRRV